MPNMDSTGFNAIRSAQMRYEEELERRLGMAGWAKAWIKKNNITYWWKQFPEGRVTAIDPREALRWEYEL